MLQMWYAITAPPCPRQQRCAALIVRVTQCKQGSPPATTIVVSLPAGVVLDTPLLALVLRDADVVLLLRGRPGSDATSTAGRMQPQSFSPFSCRCAIAALMPLRRSPWCLLIEFDGLSFVAQHGAWHIDSALDVAAGDWLPHGTVSRAGRRRRSGQAGTGHRAVCQRGGFS